MYSNIYIYIYMCFWYIFIYVFYLYTYICIIIYIRIKQLLNKCCLRKNTGLISVGLCGSRYRYSSVAHCFVTIKHVPSNPDVAPHFKRIIIIIIKESWSSSSSSSSSSSVWCLIGNGGMIQRIQSISSTYLHKGIKICHPLWLICWW